MGVEMRTVKAIIGEGRRFVNMDMGSSGKVTVPAPII